MIVRKEWKVKDFNMDRPFKERLLSLSKVSEEELEYGMEHMHDAGDINGISEAVSLIKKIILSGKRICILGDYDVDGTMATVELLKFFNSIGVESDYYIPQRLIDGYGISTNAVQYVKDNNYDMVITVDNGIAEHERIRDLKDLGICVIVTDHHECKDTLPDADVVIDLKRRDNTYPFRELCGAGVALKLIQALSKELDNVADDAWTEYIEYAAIATVADVVPLVDENRIIVKEGLKRIKSTNKKEILELLQMIGKTDMDAFCAEDIAFYVGPIINASSRVGDVDILMDFFLSDDEVSRPFIINSLKGFNEQRKKIEKEIMAEAEEQLLKDFEWTSPAPIVVYGNEWHKGVIGIVASRIVDKYKRSAIVLSKNGGEYHGSCRNCGNTNMMDILNYASSYIEKYGGHKEAAGLTVGENDIEMFAKKIRNYPLSMEDIQQEDEIELAIKISDVTIENINFIKKLEPFGCGNPKPLFIAPDSMLCHMRKIGKKEGAENAHLKAAFKTNGEISTAVDAIGFFMSDYCSFMKPGDLVSPVFEMGINVWEGQERPQMMLKNIVINSPVMESLEEDMEMDDLFMYDGVSIKELEEEYQRSFLPDETEYYPVFCKLNSYMKDKKTSAVFDIPLTAMEISDKLGLDISAFKLMRILDAIIEAGYYYGARISHSQIALKIKQNGHYMQIKQTDAYKNIHV